MKKLVSMLIFTAVLFLSGCGFLEETQNTINYATETTEYLNELSTAAEEIQTSINEGNTADLEGKLAEIEGTIQEFNSIEVPALAEGIHDDIAAQNEKLLETIDQVQANGEIALEELKNTEIVQTIESITSFMDQIEQLGFE
jgi:PBP1b-binding outer membrane lipoprotein LpoB